MKILAVLPRRWPKSKIESEFSVTDYMARQVKRLFDEMELFPDYSSWGERACTEETAAVQFKGSLSTVQNTAPHLHIFGAQAMCVDRSYSLFLHDSPKCETHVHWVQP